MFSFSTDINEEFRKNFLWKVDWEALKCITRRQNGEGEEVGRVAYRGVCVCVCMCVCVCWGSAREPSLKFLEKSIVENYHSEVV